MNNLSESAGATKKNKSTRESHHASSSFNVSFHRQVNNIHFCSPPSLKTDKQNTMTNRFGFHCLMNFWVSRRRSLTDGQSSLSYSISTTVFLLSHRFSVCCCWYPPSYIVHNHFCIHRRLIRFTFVSSVSSYSLSKIW